MEEYSNKIGKIKYTIGELRNDIEKMKLVNNNLIIIFIIQKNDQEMNKINSFQTPKVEVHKKDAYKAKKYNSLVDRGNRANKNKNKNKNYNTDIFKEDINLYKREIYNYNDYMNTCSLDSQDDAKSKIIKKYESLEDHDYINNYQDNKRKFKNKINTYLEKEDFYQNSRIGNNIREKKTKKRVFYNNLLNGNHNVDDNYNKYNSFSNMVKVKKMISSPILDSNVKKNIKEKHYNQNRKSIIDLNNDSNENINNITGKINNKSYVKINSKEDEMINYEIEKLKQEIISMQANNNILLNKLKEEKNRNSSLIAFNKNENFPSDEELQNILTDMANYLQVNSFDDIVPKLKEMIQYLNENIYEKNDKNNLRNEFISKLKELYLSLNNKKDKNETITIKVLWRWIKYMINTYKSLLIEKEKKDEILKNMEKKENYYKECCEELMNKYNMKNLEQLNKFIEELIKKNNMNKRRVEQLKKILVDDNHPQSKSEKNLKINFNKYKDEDIKYKGDS